MFKRRQQPHVEKEQALSDVLDGSSLDMIYPFSWEECADHIESGDNFIRVLAIIDYPKNRYGNWLSELKRKKGNITIVQFLESSNSTKMVEHYNKTIKNKQAEVLKTFDPLKKRLGNAHKMLMKRALFNFVGIKKVKFFEFGNMESLKGQQKKKINRVYHYFKNIGS